MDSKNGIILWVMGGAGVFLLYSGITNRTNLGENLASYLQGVALPSPNGAKPVVQGDDTPSVDYNGEKFGDFDGGVGGSFAPTKRIERDVTGTWYVVDHNGIQLEVIPDIYQSRPWNYVPQGGY